MFESTILAFLWFSKWQDAVITCGGIIFILALLPSVFGKDKPAIQTSLMTGGVLTAFAATYFSLNLWFATVTTFLTALVWFLLAFQVWSRIDPFTEEINEPKQKP